MEIRYQNNGKEQALGKVILITGAASGFGKLTAERLLSDGEWTVYGAARRVDMMKDLEQRGAHIIGMDVTSTEEVNAGVEQIIQEQGRIDVLLSNAGYASYGLIECIPLEEIQHQYEVNVFGMARVLKAVLPQMRKQGYGRVVITSSGLSGVSFLGLGWYASTKHALKGMGTALRQELKDFGIDVVMVDPAPVKTEFGTVGLEALRKIDHPVDYKECAYNVEKYLVSLESGPGPEGEVNYIVKALTDKKPRPVYKTSIRGKVFPRILPFLPDSLMDRIFVSMVKKAGKNSSQPVLTGK